MPFLYRLPDKVAQLPGPMTPDQCQIYVERAQLHKSSIPPELSFDNVIQNKALPPCALQDFMQYLTYISHEAENLQFYLWLQDYTQRFNSLSQKQQALSPPWRESDFPPRLAVTPIPPSSEDSRTRALFGEDFNFDNLGTASHEGSMLFIDQYSRFSKITRFSSGYNSLACSAGTVEFSIQPFRQEVDRITRHYIDQSSPRELNLSYRDREKIFRALQHTTHPSAFSPISALVDLTLRNQSHPNFIRWSICNGNKPRVRCVQCCGIIHIILALLLSLLLILSHASRWWRLTVSLLLFAGTDTLIAAKKGLCLLMHTTHNRDLRPWEQFPTVTHPATLRCSSSFDPVRFEEAGLSTDRILPPDSLHASKLSLPNSNTASLDPFGTSNTYAHEAWIDKYKRQSLRKKIFTPTARVQDESVRALQERILLRSHAWAALLTVVITAAVVAVPVAGVY